MKYEARPFNGEKLAKKDKFARFLRLTVPELKNASQKLDPILRLGKGGLSESVISEVNLHLKKRHLIKMKLLPSFLDQFDRKDVAKELANLTKSKLIQQVGGTVVLFKR